MKSVDEAEPESEPASPGGAKAAVHHVLRSKDPEAADETTALLPGDDKHGLVFGVCCRSTKFMSDLESNFGWRLLALLCVAQHVLKGFVGSLMGKATPYLYRAYKVPAPQAQVYGGIVTLPFAMKPILGLVSDTLPIMGYHKGPYILAVSGMSFAAIMTLGLWTSSSVVVVVIGLWLVTLQLSTTDLLTEARYAAKIQEAPQAGPAMLTYVWAGINLAGFAAVLLSGPLLAHYGPRTVFLVASVPAALILLPVALGYLEENRVTEEELAATRRRYLEQKEACFLCVIMLFATLTIMGVGLLQHNPLVNCAVAWTVGLGVLVCFSITLTPVIAKANIFAVLYTSLAASTSGATFYFYTDTPEMYPEGPHFSDYYYNTVLGTAGTAFSLLGIYSYKRWLSVLSYRTLIMTTAVVMSAFSILDVMMFARLTVRWGIPDEYLVLGLSVLETLVWQWQWMPQVVLLAALCPKGMEATMFALLAGCHNLGNTISANSGAALLHLLEVKPRGEVGESAQFEHLWVAASISSALPLVAAVLLKNLLPECKQNEALEAVEDPTSNSLLRRWLGDRDPAANSKNTD